MTRSTPFAVITVLLALILVWYLASIGLNAQFQTDTYTRADIVDVPFTQFVFDTWNQQRSLLPTPHQVFGEVWNTTALVSPEVPRSLIFHAWVTLSATLVGFAMGSALGIGLAVLIVHNHAMNRALMPWIVASQTIPILALAPLIVVIGFNIFTGTFGLPSDPARFISKTVISAYLSFFPVAVGMVSGLRSPETIQLDLMRTYSASPTQIFQKLRWPSALPFLFTSMKVGVAASLVGAIVGEVSTGAVSGLGARLLSGSYYGQTTQIWSALVMASLLAALLVIAIGIIERLVNTAMGGQPRMSQIQYYLAIVAWGLCAAALALGQIAGIALPLWLIAFLVIGTLTALRLAIRLPLWLDGIVAALGAVALMQSLDFADPLPAPYWLALVSTWLFAWLFVERLARAMADGHLEPAMFGFLIPVIFGVMILLIWEAVTRGANVPQIILPPPSAIWARIVASLPILWADFAQTFLKAVLAGYILGCGLGFIVSILIDRSPFLKRGLLPLGNFVSALPIIGVAPIMVMWFGFDWQSKAAVVVIMTFFPMLVNTVAGLNAASVIERDLMKTYAASYWQTLAKLRLPAAAPFIFNALKINSTLALIGAIVAEFFGTPTVGMGFRIVTEVGRMNVDMVWAEIAVAALAGSAFYGVIVLIERAVTFWHPSVRSA